MIRMRIIKIVTETDLKRSIADDVRRSLIRAVISGDIRAQDAAADLGISVAWLHAPRRRYLRAGDAGLVGKRRAGRGKPTHSLGFRTSAQHRCRAVRMRQELAAFRLPQQSDMPLALFKAFEALADCAEEVLERAKHELTADDFLELLDRMAATRQASSGRGNRMNG